MCFARSDYAKFYTKCNTKFLGGVGAEKLRAGETVKQHYLVADFHHPPGVIEWVFGEKAGHYLEKMGPQFTLRISSRKAE